MNMNYWRLEDKKPHPLLNQIVLFKYKHYEWYGELWFYGMSPIAKNFNSKYITVTVNRTPVRVPFNEINQIKITKYNDKTRLFN